MMDGVSVSEARLAELGLLYNLGKSFSAVLDLSELLPQIVDAAVTVTQASEGLIILRDPDTEHLTLRAMRQPSDGAARPCDQIVEDPLAAKTLEGDAPLLVNPGDVLPDVVADQSAQHSLVYVPLVTKGHATGILGVAHKSGGAAFSQHDVDMLVGLGGYAAIAIENARLYKQAVDRNQELSLLVESANALSWSLDLGQVLDAIARHMMHSLQAHWCVISSWRSETNTISRLAEHRLAVWPPHKGPLLDTKAYPAHQRAMTQGGFFIAYSGDAWLKKLGYSRMMVIPLQAEGRMVGLAEISNLHKDKPLTTRQIGQCLRVALDLGNLLDAESASQPENHLLAAARTLVETVGADWCGVYQKGAEPNSLTRRLDFGSGLWVEQSGPLLEADDLPTVCIVLEEQRIAVLRSDDPHLDPSEEILFTDMGGGALLLLPLVISGRSVGLVRLYDLDASRDFTSREIGLARALANQAAVALENAHLVHDLQHSLSELNDMQSHLVRAARLSALGELAAVIAHQINNPLTTILGDAEILAQDIPTDTPLYESALAIQRAGKRAKQVIERMLNMARYEDEARRLDANHTIREAIELVGTQIRQSGIALEVELDNKLPPVKAVPGHLEDVWMNLLQNARDAILTRGNPQGRIRIRSRPARNHKEITITVQDNGSGIEPDHLPLVFDPFFTTKPHGKGTGLGLYICRQIILDHGGQIVIASTAGKGTRVTIHLPVARSVGEEEAWPTS